MKVFKNKYYILRNHLRISGLQQWKWEYRVCTGYKARNYKREIVKEFRENGRGLFRLEDGHLPDHQPQVKEKDIIPWLEKEPFQPAFILNPGVYGLEVIEEREGK